MADKLTYISAEGLKKLTDELQYLQDVRRLEIVERITAAKALGDLKENAEYHEAKDGLALTLSRILEIKDMLKNVALIEPGAQGGVIRIGSTVTARVGSKEKTYRIVGSNEANPVEGLISNESPLGNAFLGRSLGASVDVETPVGKMTYVIERID